MQKRFPFIALMLMTLTASIAQAQNAPEGQTKSQFRLPFSLNVNR